MALSMQEVQVIPPPDYSHAKRTGPRQEVVAAVMASKSGKMRISSDDPEELKRLYRSLVQWKGRHPESRLEVRKERDCVFVWRRPQAILEGVQLHPNRLVVPASRKVGRPRKGTRDSDALAAVEALRSAPSHQRAESSPTRP
jgi:hypothetical protein